jgi:hypothetical protein
MLAQQGQDERRAVARALTTQYSRATARALRPIRAVLAAAAVAATALVALTATTAGTAASAATMQPPKVATGLTWHPLTLINGWQSAQSQYSTGNPAWAVKNGIVYLSGSLTQPGATPTSNDEFAVLPPAAQPAANRDPWYMVAYTLNSTQGFIDIGPGGALTASSLNPSDAQGFTSLAGISYPAATTATHTLSVVNGWNNGSMGGTNKLAYSVTGGIVHLSGEIWQNSGSSNPEFAVLPAAVRPAHTAYFPFGMCGPGVGTLTVKPNGQMSVSGAGAHYCSFVDGVSFPAASTALASLALIDGWQSAQGKYATGDPAYSVTGGVVHLSGSLLQPGGGAEQFAVLPSSAWPAHDVYISTFVYNDEPGAVEIQPNGEMYAFDAGNNSNTQAFTSLAGISYPAGS